MSALGREQALVRMSQNDPDQPFNLVQSGRSK